jgi:aldose 1-epimerase
VAIKEVKETPFDFFSRPEPIGRRLTVDDEQLRFGGGYDHNFVLEPKAHRRRSTAARCVCC